MAVKRPNQKNDRTKNAGPPRVAQRDGNQSIWPEPPTDPADTPGGWADNPLNPRGIPSSKTDGLPDYQATDSQKVQNPTPARIPVAATMFPDPNLERVSAGQNRKPPQEIIP
jgi:hypothetical protein